MSETRRRTTRRRFLSGSVAAGAGVAFGIGTACAPAAGGVLGANERVRLGFIGVGNRGTKLLARFLSCDEAEVSALCDVYPPYLERDRSKVSPALIKGLGGRIPPMTETLPPRVSRHKDFRRLLDETKIDAVVIATPDHWHAIQTVRACEAGKDVYVEKPLTVAIREGRSLVAAAQRHGRVVQVGLQRRSSQVYQTLREQIHAGKIGKVTVARAYRISNMWPRGIGKTSASEPPDGLDWDMWLGPRPWRPYQDNLALYKFRWWKSYSSQVANWGVHYFDAIRWLLGEEAPASVSAHGGRYAVDDDRTIPDNMEVVFEFKSGRLFVFGQYESSGGAALEEGEIELRGTLGNLYCQDSGFSVVPSAGGQFQAAGQLMKAERKSGKAEDTALAHVQNFLECVKTRKQPHCDAETGHRSTTFALLANIALETRSRIEWDSKTERITNNDEANEHLHYDYRKPWSLA